MKKNRTGAFVSLLGLLVSNISAVEIDWSNGAGDNEFSNPANWVGGTFPASESMIVDLTGANRAVVSTGTTPNCDLIRIGYNGSDGELEQTGGALTATSNASAASRVGRNGG